MWTGTAPESDTSLSTHVKHTQPPIRETGAAVSIGAAARSMTPNISKERDLNTKGSTWVALIRHSSRNTGSRGGLTGALRVRRRRTGRQKGGGMGSPGRGMSQWD